MVKWTKEKSRQWTGVKGGKCVKEEEARFSCTGSVCVPLVSRQASGGRAGTTEAQQPFAQCMEERGCC